MSTRGWCDYDPNDQMHRDQTATPEKRLWLAVIEKTVHDFRLRLGHARRDMMRRGYVSQFTLWDLKTIRYEMQSEWFWEMASYAGMDSKKIIRFLDDEAMKVGVDVNKPALNPRKLDEPPQ